MEPQSLRDTLFQCFAIIEDPRAANISHPLNEILFCVIVGVCCGADSFIAAEEIAILKKSSSTRSI